MEKKKYIGQLISVKFKDRKTAINGLVVDYNDNWTLMKYNPVDYIIDGYIIFRHINIESFQRGADEKWTEKVIKLKGLQPTNKDAIPLFNIETILKYITDKFGAFQIFTKSETVCYVGRLKSFNGKDLLMVDLDPKGKWGRLVKYKASDIRVIEFDNDYINSLKLISTSKRTKQK